MQTIAVARNAMATRFEIVLHGKNPVALRAAGEEALDEIEHVEALLSLYRPTSEIAHVNARAAREAVRVSPGVFRLLQRALELHRAIGKGHALERAAEFLREAGVASAFLHGGTSTAYGLGHPPEGEGWKVAVE